MKSRIVLLILLMAGIVAGLISLSRSQPTVHGPDDGPVLGGAYALADDLHGDPDGTIGQLYIGNKSDDIIVTAFYAVGATPDRLFLTNLRLGTGTSEHIYKNDMVIDRVVVRQFGDGHVPVQLTAQDNAVLIDYSIEGDAPVELFGFRLDYEIGSDRYIAYWPAYHCLAVVDNRIDECSELPILSVDELQDLPVTLIPPG